MVAAAAAVVVGLGFISNRIQQGKNQQQFVDVSKHIETLLYLPVVTIEATGLIKLATEGIAVTRGEQDPGNFYV